MSNQLNNDTDNAMSFVAFQKFTYLVTYRWNKYVACKIGWIFRSDGPNLVYLLRIDDMFRNEL